MEERIEKPEETKRHCFNCHAELEEGANYCHNCGQQVDQNNLRLRALLSDFFENYISFDSRFGRTLFPIFFRPGHLTLQFNEGRRRNFANPFRLYLFTSIFFFFTLSLYFSRLNEDNGGLVKKTDSELLDFSELSPEVEKLLADSLSNTVVTALNNNIDSGFVTAFDQMSKYQKMKIVEILPDSLQSELGLEVDSAYFDDSPAITFTSGSKGVQFTFNEGSFDLLDKYRYDRSMSDQQLLDSMKTEDMTPIQYLFARQMIRAYRSDNASVTKFIVGNFSFALFVIVPMFALILWLFHYRSKMFYVEHLIHAIHLHAFAFVIYGCFILIRHYIEMPDWVEVLIGIIPVIICWRYVYLSFRKVYQRRKWTSFLRVFFIGIIYFALLVVAFVVESIASLLIY